MNTLTSKNNVLEDAITDLLVRQMINSENKDFYAKNLTLGKVKMHLRDINDSAYTKIFFEAYRIARLVIQEQEIEDLTIEVEQTGCPECGCYNYIQGCTCPNCEYVEE